MPLEAGIAAVIDAAVPLPAADASEIPNTPAISAPPVSLYDAAVKDAAISVATNVDAGMNDASVRSDASVVADAAAPDASVVADAAAPDAASADAASAPLTLRQAAPFPVGVSITADQLADPQATALVAAQFSQVTPGLEMKMETVLKGAREKARSDDALLSEAMRTFDNFYSAYRSQRASA